MLTRSLIAAALLAGPAAFGYDFSALRRLGPVSDHANAIDPASRARIARLAEQAKTAGGPSVAVAVIPGLYGEPSGAVAKTIRQAWGDDILILMAMGERRVAVASREGLRVDEDELLERMSGPLSRRRTGDALTAAVQSVVDQTGGRAARPRPFPFVRYAGWLAPVAAVAWLLIRRERRTSGWSAGHAFRCQGRGGFGGSAA